MADYQFYLDYLKHVDDESEKLHRQRENNIRQEMEDKLQAAVEKSQKKIQELEAKCGEIKKKGDDALKQAKADFEKEKAAEGARVKELVDKMQSEKEQEVASLAAERSASDEKLKRVAE